MGMAVQLLGPAMMSALALRVTFMAIRKWLG